MHKFLTPLLLNAHAGWVLTEPALLPLIQFQPEGPGRDKGIITNGTTAQQSSVDCAVNQKRHAFWVADAGFR